MKPSDKRAESEARGRGEGSEPMVECVNCHKRFPLSQTVPKLGDWTETKRLCYECERALYIV